MMVEIKLKPKVLWRENFRQTDKQIDKQNLTVANFNIDTVSDRCGWMP